MKETVYAGSLNNEVFEDCFKKHYEDIFNRAQRELGLNNNLKKIVDVVDFYFSHKDIEQLTVEEVQQGMKLLNDFDFCDADGQFAREMCAYKIKIKKASGETVEDENEDNGDSTEDNEDNSSDGDDGNTSDDDRSDDEEDDIFSRHYEKRKANKQ